MYPTVHLLSGRLHLTVLFPQLTPAYVSLSSVIYFLQSFVYANSNYISRTFLNFFRISYRCLHLRKYAHKNNRASLHTRKNARLSLHHLVIPSLYRSYNAISDIRIQSSSITLKYPLYMTGSPVISSIRVPPGS